MNSEEQILRLMTEEYTRARLKNPQYSLRAFARKLGLFPSAVSEIMNGKRRITRQMGAQILLRLGKTFDETQSIAVDLKGKYRVDGLEYQEVPGDQMAIMTDWQHVALLSLIETEGFKDDVDWIAERLGAQKRVVRAILERLTRTGLIERGEDGKIHVTGKQLRTSIDIPSEVVRQGHHINLELAHRKLDDVDVMLRDFSTMTMSIDPDRLPEAKKRIQKFRRELCKYLEGGTKKEVYRLSIQVFPVTQPVKEISKDLDPAPPQGASAFENSNESTQTLNLSRPLNLSKKEKNL